jgi:hypothetical protein
MIVAAVSGANERVRFAGIQPVTESGNPAKIDQQDTPLAVETVEGDATGEVENYNEETGSFDILLKPGTPGTASILRLKADADNDAGETREITLDFNYTVKAAEAAGFNIPEPVIEPNA